LERKKERKNNVTLAITTREREKRREEEKKVKKTRGTKNSHKIQKTFFEKKEEDRKGTKRATPSSTLFSLYCFNTCALRFRNLQNLSFEIGLLFSSLNDENTL
tara:strand:+ start:229 stop:537 length:309 start_codon:yes stop_codon:yes gene_type:complete